MSDLNGEQYIEIIEKNSEQYIESVKQMMEIQDRTFNWFLAIIGILLAVAVVMQWRFSNKQLERIVDKNNNIINKKVNELKNEYEEKINTEKLENIKEIDELKKELNKLKYFVDTELLSIKLMNKNKFHIDLVNTNKLPVEKFVEFQYILDTYNSVIFEDIGLFNLYINYLDSWIFSNDDFLKEKNSEYYIDRIINTLEILEKNMKDKSQSNLNYFKNNMNKKFERSNAPS